MGHFSGLQGHIDKDKYSRWKVLRQYFAILLFVQLFLFIFMFPLQCWFFSDIAYLAPLYNLILVPWVSLVCVPLIFLTLIVPISPIIRLLDWSFMPLTHLLPYAQGHWLSVYELKAMVMRLFSYLPIYMIILGILGLVLICRLTRKYRVLLSSCMLVVYLCFLPKEATSFTWKLSVLDVGHGLFVVVEKNHHAVIYDVGRAWPGGSVAQSIGYPYLQKQQIK